MSTLSWIITYICCKLIESPLEMWRAGEGYQWGTESFTEWLSFVQVSATRHRMYSVTRAVWWKRGCPPRPVAAITRARTRVAVGDTYHRRWSARGSGLMTSQSTWERPKCESILCIHQQWHTSVRYISVIDSVNLFHCIDTGRGIIDDDEQGIQCIR